MSEAGLREMYERLADFFSRFVGPEASSIDAGERQPRVLSKEEREQPRFEIRLGPVAHL